MECQLYLYNIILTMWFSFTMSEIRGLTKSKSIYKGYITIREVVVSLDREDVRKTDAKEETSLRRHKMPPYIKKLVDEVHGDILVSLSARALSSRFAYMIQKSGLPKITFHGLRHINASVMHLLGIPEKYFLERGGWKTDKVMKKVYKHTFSKNRQEADTKVDTFFEAQIANLNSMDDAV